MHVWVAIVAHLAFVGHMVVMRPDLTAEREASELLGEGRRAVNRREIDAAVEAYRTVLSRYAETTAAAEASSILGILLVRQAGQIEAGREVLEDCVRRHPGTDAAAEAAELIAFLDEYASETEPLRLYLAAEGATDLRKWNRAAKGLELLLGRYPTSTLIPAALFQMARVETARGHATEAQAYRDRLRREHPASPWTARLDRGLEG